MSAERVIATALAELGNTENPAGSNLTKYGEAYGWNGVPWCVIFLWWCFREAGEAMAFFNSGKTASCSKLVELYQAEGKWFTENFQPGDIAVMTFAANRAIQHCGLIVEIHWKPDASLDYVVTVEGNTSPGMEGSQYNGGCVAKKRRYSHNILGVCRPTYTEEIPMPKTDYEGHWAEQHIRWELDIGISQGYPDGSYKPDNALTRAENATKMHRYDAIIETQIEELRREVKKLRQELEKLKEGPQ